MNCRTRQNDTIWSMFHMVPNGPEGAMRPQSGRREQRAKRVAIFQPALNRKGGLRRPQPLGGWF